MNRFFNKLLWSMCWSFGIWLEWGSGLRWYTRLFTHAVGSPSLDRTGVMIPCCSISDNSCLISSFILNRTRLGGCTPGGTAGVDGDVVESVKLPNALKTLWVLPDQVGGVLDARQFFGDFAIEGDDSEFLQWRKSDNPRSRCFSDKKVGDFCLAFERAG